MALSFFWVYDAQPCLSCEHHQVKIQASDMFQCMEGMGALILSVFFSQEQKEYCV